MFCILGYLYGISCESFAEFDENGSVIRLPESDLEADAILEVSRDRIPIKRRNSFIEALALLPQSISCSTCSSSPERASDLRQFPAALARRKMRNEAYACV